LEKELESAITVVKSTTFSIFINLRLPSDSILIVFFYLSADCTYNSKLRTMKDVAKLGSAFPKTLLMGDANAHVGSCNSSVGQKRVSKDEKLDAIGKIIINYAEELGLQIGNGATYGDRNVEIFISSANQGKSVIDLLLFSFPSLPLIQKLRVQEMGHSSHFPIITPLSLTAQENQKMELRRPKIKLPTEPERILHLKIAIEHTISKE
jgi:hypothetical protein